jgi:hypothetical protein
MRRRISRCESRLTLILCIWIPFSAAISVKSSNTSSILALLASLRNSLAPDERTFPFEKFRGNLWPPLFLQRARQ